MSNRKLKDDEDIQCDGYVVGKVKSVVPIEVVSSKNGKEYEKMVMLVDCTANEDYPTLVEVVFFAVKVPDKVKEAAIGDKVAIQGTISTRLGAGGKGYTSFKGLYLSLLSRGKRRPEGGVDRTERESKPQAQPGKYKDEDMVPF